MKRGIAGSLVFTVFDRDTLFDLKENSGVYRHGLNTTELLSDADVKVSGVHDLARELDASNLENSWKQPGKIKYIDEIPPFDITVNFMNEYGQSSVMKIYGVEILNEGMGLSVDDITSEKACTFIARNIEQMSAGSDDPGDNI